MRTAACCLSSMLIAVLSGCATDGQLTDQGGAARGGNADGVGGIVDVAGVVVPRASCDGNA